MHWHRVHSQFGRYSCYMCTNLLLCFWKYNIHVDLLKVGIFTHWAAMLLFSNITLLVNAINKYFSIKKWQTKVHCALKVNSKLLSRGCVDILYSATGAFSSLLVFYVKNHPHLSLNFFSVEEYLFRSTFFVSWHLLIILKSLYS